MIYDKLTEIGKYRKVSPWFEKAVTFLETTDLHTLPLGRTEICENHVFINVMEAETVPEEKVEFEIHKKYWDVQIDLEGTEQILVATDKGSVKKPFEEAIDFGTFACQEAVRCIMGPGRFIVCMKEEPHKPSVAYKGCSHIKKCVIKVEAIEG